MYTLSDCMYFTYFLLLGFEILLDLLLVKIGKSGMITLLI